MLQLGSIVYSKDYNASLDSVQLRQFIDLKHLVGFLANVTQAIYWERGIN